MREVRLRTCIVYRELLDDELAKAKAIVDGLKVRQRMTYPA